jgi:hypothetical protein
MSQAEQTTRDRPAIVVAYQKPEFWAKGFGKLIFSNLLVLVMCVIPLELYFGSWVRPKPWGLLCDAHLTFSEKSMYGVEKTIDYVRDSQCLRGSYNASSIDVITVGGSTTDQRYLTEGETWQDSIVRYFHRNGRQLSIANAGVDGQSTIGHLWDFEYWFPKLSSQPKVYLFYIGVNDIYRTSPAGDFDNAVRRIGRLENLIKGRSALYHLYRTIVGVNEAQKMGVTLRPVNFSEMSYTEKPLLKDYSFYDEYLQHELIPRLDALAGAARNLGSEPIFVTQRTYFWREINGHIHGIATTFNVGGIEVNGVDRFVMERAQIKAILNFCKSRKLSCIDGDQAVNSEEDFHDFVHNTPQGAEKLGTYIGERLLKILN